MNRPDEITESDIGTQAGLFEVRKIGDEYFTFIEECADPKACTILLRGASKDILNEVERNLQDAMHVARNICLDPRLVPGGGAVEMEVCTRDLCSLCVPVSFHLYFQVSRWLNAKAKQLDGVIQGPYRAVANALEIIPRTITSNCGANTIRTLTALRAKHAEGDAAAWGVDGMTGKLEDMAEMGVLEPLAVKMQTYKTAVETAILLLRIDDIVSGSKKKGDGAGAQ